MTAFSHGPNKKHMRMQMIEDKTFGLKNKNKSKSVQVWNRLFTTVNDCYASSFERLAGIIRAVVSSHQPSSLRITLRSLRSECL